MKPAEFDYKRARTLPKILSIAEVDGLLTQARTQAEDSKSPPAVRLRAARLLCLLEVVSATGLRVSELVALPASAARRRRTSQRWPRRFSPSAG